MAAAFQQAHPDLDLAFEPISGTLSVEDLLAGIGGDAAIAWLGVDDLRMLQPVKLGDTVRVIVEVKGQQPTSNPRKGVQVWRYTVRNQRDADVMAFDYKMLFHMRG